MAESEIKKEKERKTPKCFNVDVSTREHILTSAVKLLGTMSINRLSVRAIAADAGLNVSAVHYHFHTKDLLVAEALKSFFSDVIAELEHIHASDGSARERLKAFLSYYVGMLFNNPGIFGSIIDHLIEMTLFGSEKKQSLPEQIIGGSIERGGVYLREMVRVVSGETDESRVNMLTVSLLTSVLNPILLTAIPERIFGFSMQEKETRDIYLDLCIDQLR